jgi:aryl-alcohol dehydrogenase-like predicted oxidoreductase
MQRIILNNTGLNVSRVCFGTMTFAGQTAEAEARQMIDLCLDSGIDFFDTANMYHQGASEALLGKTLKGKRNRIVLASKVRIKMGDQPDMAGLSKRAIFRAIDESLQRLQTDYLDIYYLHWPDTAVAIEETLEAMHQLVRQGKIRHVASSNYASWQVVEMLSLAEKNGYSPALITQTMYNIIARDIEHEYLPMCRRFGVSTLVYNPLAGGLLSGKHRQQAPQPGSRFDNNQLYLDRYWHAADFKAVDALKKIAVKAGRSLVSLSLNWIYHHTPVNGIVIGASRVEQLEQNLTALEDGPIDDETLRACDQVWVTLRGPAPNYNRW